MIKGLTIKQASEKLAKKEISSEELTKAYLERIKKHDKEINSFITVTEEEALKQAKEADERRAKGEDNPLLGIPYQAKDVLMTKGIRTTAASKILENYIAPFDATVVTKVKEAGAVMLGKGNCDEFAHGASGENSAYGPTKNPWDLERVAGGSSSGPGAVVASDMSVFSIGTDTGGSVRCPASFCGLSALRPTYGRNSRFGLISMTSSMDTAGPIARTVEDISFIMQAIAGLDKRDATTVDEPVPDYSKFLEKDIKGLKIGVPYDFFQETNKEIKELFEKALEDFKKKGAEIVPIKLPHAKYGIPVYYIITPSEISSNLARLDGIRYGLSEDGEDIKEIYYKSRGKGFGQEAKRRVMLGTYALSAGYYDAYYLKAQKVRTKIAKELDKALETVDVIATPTQPDIAFKIGEQSDDPLKMYLEDMFLSPASLAGIPAISMPCGFLNKMPVGIQLMAKRFDEGTLFQAGHNYQQITDWHKSIANID